MKKLSVAILLFIPFCLMAQRPENAPATRAFHYQRSSLFELLPVGKKDIVFLGNSITNGCEWSELFKNPKIKNRGINSDKTYEVLERLGPLVEGKPKKVFLLIGTNDLGANFTPEFVAANIKLIVERFQSGSPSTKLYIQSIMPVNDQADASYNHLKKGKEIREANILIEKLCAEKGVTYIDLWEVLADDSGRLKTEYTNDGLHLMGSGYIAWKGAIEKYVK